MSSSVTNSYNGSAAEIDELAQELQLFAVIVYVLFAAANLACAMYLYRGSSPWMKHIEYALTTATNGGQNDLATSADHGVHHLCIIMDGNRRYGKSLLDRCEPKGKEICSPSIATLARSPLNGHRAGGEKLMEFIDYCLECNIEMLTVYAFSTENWNRSKIEVDVLMALFEIFFQRIRDSARSRGIFIRFVVSDHAKLPGHILSLMRDVEEETRRHQPRRIVVNCCVSYGGRAEIVDAARRLMSRGATDVSEEQFEREMLRSITQHLHEHEDEDVFGRPLCSRSPQALLRTSGERRISNFLLYELAYTEMYFVDKTWPEVTKEDLVELLRDYSRRNRRFGR